MKIICCSLLSIENKKSYLFLQDNLVFFRGLMILGAGLMATFGSTAVHLSGAGPLGCLTIAFIAGFRWRKEVKDNKVCFN